MRSIKNVISVIVILSMITSVTAQAKSSNTEMVNSNNIKSNTVVKSNTVPRMAKKLSITNKALPAAKKMGMSISVKTLARNRTIISASNVNYLTQLAARTITKKITEIKESVELTAVKKAGIAVQTLSDAQKKNSLVHSLDFGYTNDLDTYRVKYLGKKSLGKTAPYRELVFGNDNTYSLTANNYADKLIRACFKSANKYTLSGGNMTYMCTPGILNKAEASPYITLDTASKKIIESRKDLIVVADVLEIGYDNVKKQYYVRSSKIDELTNSSFTKLSSSSPNKYIALTRLVVKPHDVTDEEKAVIAAGIPILSVDEAKRQGLYLDIIPKVIPTTDPYENAIWGKDGKYYGKYTGLFGDCDSNIDNLDVDQWVRRIYQCKTLYRVTSKTDVNSYVCAYSSDVASEPIDSYGSTDNNNKVESGAPMMYVLQVEEIGYDSVNRLFYTRRIFTKFFESGNMVKNVAPDKFTPYKYVARIQLAAEPKN